MVHLIGRVRMAFLMIRDYKINESVFRYAVMKMLFFLIFLIASAHITLNAQEKLFVTLKRGAVHIVYDTVLFKTEVLDIVFSDYTQKPSLTSLRIVHKPVVGDPTKRY